MSSLLQRKKFLASFCSYTAWIFTARKQSLRRLCFHRCLSVHRGEYLGRYPPGQVHPPWQVHPPAGTPLGRYTPWQVHPSLPAERIRLECILVEQVLENGFVTCIWGRALLSYSADGNKYSSAFWNFKQSTKTYQRSKCENYKIKDGCVIIIMLYYCEVQPF